MNEKTILLENNDFLWEGCEAWCNSFDPNFSIYKTEKREWMYSHDLMDAAMLSQPFIGRLMVCSAFQSTMYTPIRREVCFQIEHWLEIIRASYSTRQKLGYPPFEILINYNGDDFLTDVVDDEWGNGFHRSLKTFVRQNPELKIRVFHEYEEQYTLSEKLFESAMQIKNKD